MTSYMGGLGKTDTIAYLACYGVLHSPREGQTPRRAKEQFDQLLALYPDAAPILTAFSNHLELDLLGAHDQITFEKYVRSNGLSPDEAFRALQAVTGIVRRFNDFFDGIWTRHHCL